MLTFDKRMPQGILETTASDFCQWRRRTEVSEVQQLSADRHHTTDRSVYAPPRQGGTGTYSGVNTQVFSLQIPTGLPVIEHEICVIWITSSHRERVTWWSILSTVTYLFWFICQIELLNNLGHLLLLGPSTIFNKTLKAFWAIKKMGIMKTTKMENF